jgi:hypothetical protein
VKLNAAIEYTTDHRLHVFGLEGMAQTAVTHAAPGAIGHFAILYVISRARKKRTVARMVVVHVRDDHVLHRVGANADFLQTVLDGMRDRAPTLAGHFGVEPRVYDECARLADHRPDEVVERHRYVVRVAAEKVLGRATVVECIFDGEDTVVLYRRRHVSMFLFS